MDKYECIAAGYIYTPKEKRFNSEYKWSSAFENLPCNWALTGTWEWVESENMNKESKSCNFIYDNVFEASVACGPMNCKTLGRHVVSAILRVPLV